MIAKVTKYIVSFKDIKGNNVLEVFDTKEEALMFAKIIFETNPYSLGDVAEAEKIIVNNQAYYILKNLIERKEIKKCQ